MGRLLLALPVSLFVCVSLFSCMAWMIDKGNQSAPKASETVRFDMLMVENEAEIQRRQRSVPKPPAPPKEPKPVELSLADTLTEPMGKVMPFSSLGLTTALDGVAISAPNLNGMLDSQQALPLYRAEPRYPSKALKRRIEGYVIMRFTIDVSGHPKDIKVTEAKPPRMFEREAIRALKKWKYQPKVENGVSIEQLGQSVKVEFNLAK